MFPKRGDIVLFDYGLGPDGRPCRIKRKVLGTAHDRTFLIIEEGPSLTAVIRWEYNLRNAAEWLDSGRPVRITLKGKEVKGKGL